jgi:hypothetical protein
VTFTATATTGTATTIALASGNSQSGSVNTAVANRLVVTVSDAGGNLVQGTSVSFAFGSVPTGASGQSLNPTSTTTDATGQASTALTLGNTAGTYTVQSTSTGLTGSPVTFTATATATSAIISLSTSSVSFGSVIVGNSSQQTFTVSNGGTATLTVSGITSTGAFSVSPTSLSIGVGGSAQAVTVTFLPTSAGTQSGTITLSHNALGGSSAVSLTGVGATTTIGIGTSTGRFSGGIPASQWVLMSVPYILDNLSASAQFSSQLTGTNPWRMYNASSQDITSSSFQIGAGFWFKTVAKTSSFSLLFGSGTVFTQSTFSISLPTGWSIVGTPFYNNEATWTPVNTTPGSTGSSAIRVWKYNHESGSWSSTPLNPSVEAMKPFGGYAVYNNTGATATLTLTRGNVSTKIAREWEDGDGWYLALKAGNASLRIGEHRNASTGSDYYDYPVPPSPPESDAEYPSLSGKLWSDIRPVDIESVSSWKILVNPSTCSSVSVEESFGIPAGWRVLAEGIPDVGTVDLLREGGFTLPAGVTTPFTLTIVAGPTSTVELQAAPTSFSLGQNYPNPFNPSTTIAYALTSDGEMSLKLFDVRGEEMATLVHGFQKAGMYEVRWDGRDRRGETVPSGLYFYTLQTGSNLVTKKMLLLK